MAKVVNKTRSVRDIQHDQEGKRIVNYTNSSSVHSFNGGFVGSCFLLTIIFMIVVLVVGSFKHEPMEMVIGVAQRVSDYGEGFVNDLNMFTDVSNELLTSETDDTIRITYWTSDSLTHTLMPHTKDIKIPKTLIPAWNGIINVVKFLLIVPYAIGSLAVRLIVLITRVIGFCFIL